MTAILSATSASVYAVARAAGSGSPADPTGTAHAVSRPVVDGLTASECGALVDVAADRDWHDVPTANRCAECERIAG